MITLEDLNGLVTEAILRAEDADRVAARAWLRVSALEEQIADRAPDPLERAIAQRGAITAAAKAKDRALVRRLRLKYPTSGRAEYPIPGRLPR